MSVLTLCSLKARSPHALASSHKQNTDSQPLSLLARMERTALKRSLSGDGKTSILPAESPCEHQAQSEFMPEDETKRPTSLEEDAVCLNNMDGLMDSYNSGRVCPLGAMTS